MGLLGFFLTHGIFCSTCSHELIPSMCTHKIAKDGLSQNWYAASKLFFIYYYPIITQVFKVYTWVQQHLGF